MNEIFNYEEWDQFSNFNYMFYYCILKRKIGQFEEGTFVNFISINFAENILTIFDKDDVAFNYRLDINISDSLDI